MRLNSADSDYLQVLKRLRNAACTSEDIHLIRTRLGGRLSKEEIKRFDGVSIITGLNNIMDGINNKASESAQTNENIRTEVFFSEDSKRSNGLKRTPHLSRSFQYKAWETSPAKTESLPGRITIWKGMPVIIKANEAVELGITNGASGVVVDWVASSNEYREKRTLEVVFVELKNLRTRIQLQNLPLNTVPIMTDTKGITCQFETVNESQQFIRRKQVPLIPEFAKTIHVAQGMSRTLNGVDIADCRNHQLAYVALSRSRSLRNMPIIRDFDEKKLNL